MKITKRQLRRVIREEASKLAEDDASPSQRAFGYYDAISKLIYDEWAAIGIDLTAPDGMQEEEYVKQALKSLLADLEAGQF